MGCLSYLSQTVPLPSSGREAICQSSLLTALQSNGVVAGLFHVVPIWTIVDCPTIFDCQLFGAGDPAYDVISIQQRAQ